MVFTIENALYCAYWLHVFYLDKLTYLVLKLWCQGIHIMKLMWRVPCLLLLHILSSRGWSQTTLRSNKYQSECICILQSSKECPLDLSQFSPRFYWEYKLSGVWSVLSWDGQAWPSDISYRIKCSWQCQNTFSAMNTFWWSSPLCHSDLGVYQWIVT